MIFPDSVAVVVICLAAFLLIAVIELAAILALRGIRFLPARLGIRLIAIGAIGLLAIGAIIATVVAAYHRVALLLPAI